MKPRSIGFVAMLSLHIIIKHTQPTLSSYSCLDNVMLYIIIIFIIYYLLVFIIIIIIIIIIVC